MVEKVNLDRQYVIRHVLPSKKDSSLEKDYTVLIAIMDRQKWIILVSKIAYQFRPYAYNTIGLLWELE